jgi:hypothetical protein
MKNAHGTLADLQELAPEAKSAPKEHFAFFKEHSLPAIRTKNSESIANGILRQAHPDHEQKRRARKAKG